MSILHSQSWHSAADSWTLKTQHGCNHTWLFFFFFAKQPNSFTAPFSWLYHVLVYFQLEAIQMYALWFFVCIIFLCMYVPVCMCVFLVYLNTLKLIPLWVFFCFYVTVDKASFHMQLERPASNSIIKSS